MRTSNNDVARCVSAVFVATAFGFGLLLAFHGSTTAQDAPRVSEVCLDCHEDYEAALARTTHHLSSDNLDGPEARVACTDCHAGNPGHWEDDPEEYAMTNPAKVNASAEAAVCSKCHQNSHQQNMVEKNVHYSNDVSCSGCHSIHASAGNPLLKTAEVDLCLSCHTSVAGQFAKPFRHPVNDGIVKCSECHMSLDQTRVDLSYSGTTVCVQCHPEFEGPFPFEHQAAVEYSTEEGACLTCHEPHGSYLPRMLKQPYEAPNFQLCTQCHVVPLHSQNSQHGTTWAGVPCNECHTDIHGSYVNDHFLRESLEGEGCFVPGCHEF